MWKKAKKGNKFCITEAWCENEKAWIPRCQQSTSWMSRHLQYWPTGKGPAPSPTTLDALESQGNRRYVSKLRHCLTLQLY